MLAMLLLAATAPWSQAAQSTSVPFTLFDKRMVIAASLDGKGPFFLIVDTGSGDVVITPEVTRRLHLRTRQAGSVTGAGSGSAATSATRLSSLDLGSLRFENLAVDVIDLSSIRRAIGFPHLDGIVGYDVLRRLRVGVDMDASRLTLSYAPLPVPKDATSTGFSIAASGIIQVPGAVDGVHGTFVLDTGDRFSLTLFRHFAQANDFYRDAPVHNAITGMGIGGPVYSDVLRTTVSLFGSTIPGVVTRASRDQGGAFATGPQDASAGTGLLKRFNIVYDYPDRELFAWPSRFFNQLDTYRPLALENGALHVAPSATDPTTLASPLPALPRHGVLGAAVAQSPGGVSVSAIVPRSAAAQAGLHTGDTIRAVNGTPVASVAEFLSALHDLHAGQRVLIDVGRNGQQLQLSAILEAPSDESEPGIVTQYGTIVVDDSLRRTLLTMPASLTAPAPAVLLIGGIGCYSVDVAANPQDAYMHLTHDLARTGFVTMRLEKSGVGDSQGPPCRNVDFEGETRGYVAALAALQRAPHVDPARLYLLGHSIGTIIAPRLALSNRVAGIVVLEAVGSDWPEYEIRNLRRDLELDGESPPAVDEALIEKAQCLQRLFFENQSEAEIERSLPSCRVHNGIYPVSAAYMQEVAHLNIIEPWTRLGIPVLAVYGISDFETELADHERIVGVVNASHPQSATLAVLPAMSHGLGRAASDKAAETDDTRGTLEPYDTDLSRIIIAWLRGLSRTADVAF
jgi:Aspartyl protease/PDZ domain/Serine aminopeptidase, S33